MPRTVPSTGDRTINETVLTSCSHVLAIWLDKEPPLCLFWPGSTSCFQVLVCLPASGGWVVVRVQTRRAFPNAIKNNNSWAVIQPGKPWKCGFRVNSNRIQHRARLKGTPSMGEVSIPSSGCCKYVQLCAHTCLESFPTNRNPPTPACVGNLFESFRTWFFFSFCLQLYVKMEE